MTMREIVARALCVRGGFDPDQMMPNDGPRWRYYLDGADAAIAVVLEAAAGVATSFLVGDPKNGIPLRNPMAHEIADRIRALKGNTNDT